MKTSSPTSVSSYTVDVLLVDDSRNLCRTLQIWLNTQGYTSLTANSADEAQQLAIKQTPRVVITDLGLPDRSGYDLLKTLREIEALNQSHCIALSGDTDSQEKEHALRAGFDCFVNKPPNFKILSEMLHRCIGRSTEDQTTVTN